MPVPRKKHSSGRSPNAKARTGKTPAARSRRRSSCRLLLVIDNEPIRREALTEYYRIEQELSEAREHIEAFEGGDLPAYQRWEAQLFGPLLTELRASLQAVEEKRGILLDVEEEMFWGRCSPSAAYRRVMKRRESPQLGPDPEAAEWQGSAEGEPEPGGEEAAGNRLFGDSDLPPDFDIDEFDRMTPRKQKKFREDYRMLSLMYEMMTGNKAPDLDEVLRQERARKGRANAETSTAGQAYHLDEQKFDRPGERLKELYRKLVRQLHPDSAQDLTERERELWHEVQEAYRARDLERMEAVAGRIEIGLGGSAMNLPMQVILRMTQDLKDALYGLDLRIASVRKHPAWLFRSKSQELAKMEKKHRRVLTAELRRVNAELAELTAYMAEISSRAGKSPRRKGKKKSSQEYADDVFF